MISIIIPVFNVERYLRRCLDSIITQTFTDWECILVDDGNSDASGAICDEYAARNTSFKVIHKDNGGVSSARNAGPDKARGEYIYFVDSDDCLQDGGLSTLVGSMSEDVGLVMAGHRTYDEGGNSVFTYNREIEGRLSTRNFIHALYYGWEGSYQGYLWIKLFRAETIRKHNLRFDENISFNEDRLFVVRYFCVQPCGVFFTTRAVYNYFRRETSAMKSLEHSFNYKFITDLYAFEQMLTCVKSLHSRSLTFTAMEGIYKSAKWIRSMARRFAIRDKAAVCAETYHVVHRNIDFFSLLCVYYKVKIGKNRWKKLKF